MRIKTVSRSVEEWSVEEEAGYEAGMGRPVEPCM